MDGIEEAGRAWFRAMGVGDFAGAFRANDLVLGLRDPAGRDDPGVPFHQRWVWDGRGVAGRRVLVRCYHGLGDTIQFARFLPELGRVARSVTVEAQGALVPLLRGMGVGEVVAFDPARPLPPAEVDVEVMELAHALRAVPEAGPFLRVAADPAGVGRVGVCWSGGGWDRGRDVPGALLRPLVVRLGGRGVSLQRGAAAGELALEDPLEGSMDVARLAGLVAGLELVVTVDTMVAHLAGALGRPVLLMLKKEADWRWGCEGAWYAGVRQFRQGRAGDWAGVVAGVEGTLEGTVG